MSRLSSTRVQVLLSWPGIDVFFVVRPRSACGVILARLSFSP